MMNDLCTDLRRVSSAAPQHFESALTSSIRKSLDTQSPWLKAAEQLSHFPTKRCVQMRPEDWQELSSVLASITRLCNGVKQSSTGTCGPPTSPGFALTLELLLKLGQVTSCLLCVNGDDRSFSIARVAQAIRTTTSVLQAAIAQAAPAGLTLEVADSLARQRCEQTPLLSAVAWALRQEARALFFNPRPTALSLATALLDMFRTVEQLWPLGIFVPQYHEAALDPTAARMADPAAQLAVAMLRCAGRALSEAGSGACRESLLSGLTVGYDLVHQISLLLDAEQLPSREALLKQLQQSPSLPQLMLALLVVETQRLNQQLGLSEADSCIQLQPQQQQQRQPRRQSTMSNQHSKLHSCGGNGLHDGSSGGHAGALPSGEQQERLDTCSSAKSSRRGSAVGSPTAKNARSDPEDPQQQQPSLPGAPLSQLHRTLSQQRLQQQQLQQQQQQQQEEEEHAEIEGAGELHQVWHQVLGMARKNMARDGQAGAQQQQEDEGPRSPLMQLWASLGLPAGLMQLAADAGVSPAAPVQQYVAICRVGKFLLQGSPLLQPQHAVRTEQHTTTTAAAAAAAAAAPGSAGGGAALQQPASATSAANKAAALLSPDHASPFAAAGRTTGRSWSTRAGAGALPAPWLNSSPPGAASITASPGVSFAGAFSFNDTLGPLSSVGSLSPREYLAAGALSLSAEAAEQLMETCRDYGLQGQEELELLRLQRVVPVVLLNTAAALLQFSAAQHAAEGTGAAPGAAATSSSRDVSPAEALQVVHAACTAAACVSRCWPVLQKVASQQEELCDVLAECHPPAGVFAGLSTVCWQQYTLPAEVRLPLLPLLQLVARLIWQLLPPWQQQQQQRQECILDGPCKALLLQQQQQQQQESLGFCTANSCSGPQLLPPAKGECLDSLLEVLTAVSKLPWELPADPTAHSKPAGNASDAGSDTSSDSEECAADADARLVAEAWQQECQPVAAAVEACLRTAAQVAAAAHGAQDWRPLDPSAAAAAAQRPKVQRHPSAVSLGACLAALCAPFGRPGPLVAAAAAADPGGPEQRQLYALLLSKLKVLLYNPASKKASLIAMHPIEQTPIYILQQLSARRSSPYPGDALTAVSTTRQHPAAAADATQQLASPSAAPRALLPWLLLLSRLLVLRGQLLGHVLAVEAVEAGKAGATSALHTAYWHIKMAHDSASTLSVHTDVISSTQVQQALSELQLQLLPALKQAVQVLRAAMKLSRHYHETGFASGFAAGFAAGYAAAVAAASGFNGSSGALAPGPVSFASPWGVLQQSCIRSLPQQLEAVGSQLAWHLCFLGCSNPTCVNLSAGSELWLIPEEDSGDEQQHEGRGSSLSRRGRSAGVAGSAEAGWGGGVGPQEAGEGGGRVGEGAPRLCSSCDKLLNG